MAGEDASSESEVLFRLDPSHYTGTYGADLLEQYKLYAQTHEKISERREGANRFFLGLNTVVAGALGLRVSERPGDVAVILACLAAIGVCWYWRRAVRAYDNLNTGKFKVIFAIERRLPLALYEAERKALGEGKNPAFYQPVSHIERGIPVVFAALYAAIIAAGLLH